MRLHAHLVNVKCICCLQTCGIVIIFLWLEASVDESSSSASCSVELQAPSSQPQTRLSRSAGQQGRTDTQQTQHAQTRLSRSRQVGPCMTLFVAPCLKKNVMCLVVTHFKQSAMSCCTVLILCCCLIVCNIDMQHFIQSFQNHFLYSRIKSNVYNLAKKVDQLIY